jgi:hypothetical protein
MADGFCPHAPDSYHHAPMCCGSQPRNHTVAFRVKTVSPSESPQFPLRHRADFRRHRIPQTIGGIIPADSIIVSIHFQHIFGPIRVVLERWNGLNEPFTALMDE